jgi:hypothetical protein
VLFIAWRHSFLSLFRVVLARASNCKWSIKQEAVLKAKRETLHPLWLPDGRAMIRPCR